MSALEQIDHGPVGRPQPSASELYRRHRRRLLGFCIAQTGSREEGEDAVQDTFIYALAALRRGVVPQCELAWLLTIARHVCQTRRRNRSRRSEVVVTRDLDALQDVVAAREQNADELYGLHEALAALPDTQRQAILLREWQGLSYREIARELELSLSAVETLLFRARRSLARRLERPARAVAGALNLPVALGGIRGLLEGGAAKVAAGALAVAATSTVAATLPAVADPVAPAPEREAAPLSVPAGATWTRLRPVSVAPARPQLRTRARAQNPLARQTRPRPLHVAAPRPRPAAPPVPEVPATEPARPRAAPAEPVAAPPAEPVAAPHAAPEPARDPAPASQPSASPPPPPALPAVTPPVEPPLPPAPSLPPAPPLPAAVPAAVATAVDALPHVESVPAAPSLP